ncbi:hypothetical protein [Sphingosinicella sp. BN140058]|uniref:hypothetical protein n=1 Tax=Sphingosinicella sp. BN140058 TaxID=1892855 RepID=UPI00101067AB|nr:hypothetical protein [Sphingosinicella sp. BN140058]QAY75939.1 hypothetical protein ETR14_04910 [Sphingosinicella sp. BN140058]
MSEGLAPDTAVAKLHATFARRDTPEAVAAIIGRSLPPAIAARFAAMIAARVAVSHAQRFGWSSMPSVFEAPAGSAARFDRARQLALLFLGAEFPAGDDAEAIAGLVAEMNALIGKRPGAAGFKADRLSRSQRSDCGLPLSRRRYDKLFRLAGRLEAKLVTLRAEEAKHRLLLVARAGLAPELGIEQLRGSLPTAAFVAYYAARLKLRSEFTIDGQQKPFDDLAAELLHWCEEDPGTDWYAIAHVFPRADVLARLTERQKGILLGRWFAILIELAGRLEETWRRSDIDLATMIVRRGNDSSTWNLFAAAWNRAREHWIALVEALGMEAVLDEMLPGKVMRLMAADVAAWHRMDGGDVHPDTKVWRELPKPWAVLRSEIRCTRATIEAACARARLDPVASGWSAARQRTMVQTFRPTPELVHGVDVGNPYLARLLKRLGVFSGKPMRTDRLSDLEQG